MVLKFLARTTEWIMSFFGNIGRGVGFGSKEDSSCKRVELTFPMRYKYLFNAGLNSGIQAR